MVSCNPSNDGSRPGNADGFTVRINAKTFPPAGGVPAVKVLENLTFHVATGELLAIIGPSGCGKTTLLNILAGLDLDFSGEVPTVEKTGFVFQSPRLLPWMSVADNLRFVLNAEEEDDASISAMLESVGLQGHENVFANRLSMGMARRAGLARALLVQPDLLLLDEPFVSLDEGTAGKLRTLLSELLDKKPWTSLFVTHDLDEAVALADRILVLGQTPSTVVSEERLDKPRKERDPDWRSEALSRVRSKVSL